MMKHLFKYLILLILPLFHISCMRSGKTGSPFTFKATMDGIELRENGNPVYFYRKEPKKSTTGDYNCNNYLHPLYNLKGDTLTEEFPADHPYHTGIFWTWHQLYQNNRNLGDGWVWEGISKDVISANTETDETSATLKLDVLWKSDTLTGDDKSFLDEYTTIIVHQAESGVRKIDFTIILKALVPGFSVGGSDDPKGYGGLCARIRLPGDLTFTSTGGEVIPQNLQITAGPWMDFSADFGTGDEGKNGIAILCHPSTPNYPAPWILRQVTSMQNIVYPGRERVDIPMPEPVILHYRLIVHDGGPGEVDLNALQKEYSGIKYEDKL